MAIVQWHTGIVSSVIAIGSICIVLLNSARGDETTFLNESIDRVIDATNGDEMSESYRLLFQQCDDSTLDRLRVHENDSLAIMSRWEQITKTLGHVKWPNVYDQTNGVMIRYNRRELHSFLGLLEGRLRSRVPTWWQDTFVTMRTTFGPRDLTLRSLRNAPQYEFHDELNLWSAEGTEVTIESGEMRALVDDTTFLIPQLLLENSDESAFAMAGTTCHLSSDASQEGLATLFVLLHSPFPGDYAGALLLRISPGGDVIWQQPLRCHSVQTGGSGQPWCAQRFEILVDETNDRIHLFGADVSMLQVHSFLIDTGSPVFSFNTQWGPSHLNGTD